jgi:NADPH-dependent 2,4-dienoyl-CoA reductase/sulfur reductase-like enzyme/rhodanese-related sulfurtransferase
MEKVLIIGGMAAGCKTAARLKRIKPECEVTIIERKSFISFGTCGMPLYASGEVDSFLDLAKTSWGTVRDASFFREAKDIEVLTETLVEKIDYNKRTAECLNLKNNERININFDKLVICTGAKAVQPSFPCSESYKISNFHNPLDAKKFRELTQKGKVGKAVIIGGGYIGCELAEALVSLWGIETYIIELQNRLLPNTLDKEMSALLEKTFLKNDIKVFLNSHVERIESKGELPVVYLDTGETIESDYVFLCLGLKPEVELAKSIGIKTGKFDGILIDSQMRTNLPDVWAGGDCLEIKNLITGNNSFFPLGSLANRQGRVIAESIAGLDSSFEGAVGANSIKVFGLIIAQAGLNETSVINQDINYSAVWGTWYDRPDYHPESKTLFGKLIYEKDTLKLIGLQLVGMGEVTRYIDVFTALAQRRGTVKDLIDVEHAYTPPHSSPMNPLNFMGAMALAQEQQGVRCLNPLFYDKFQGKVLDVRESIEIDSESAIGINYPVTDYKKHLEEFKKDEPLLIVCAKGSRSYEAVRTFMSKGFTNVCYLGGGIQLAHNILDEGED